MIISYATVQYIILHMHMHNRHIQDNHSKLNRYYLAPITAHTTATSAPENTTAPLTMLAILHRLVHWAPSNDLPPFSTSNVAMGRPCCTIHPPTTQHHGPRTNPIKNHTRADGPAPTPSFLFTRILAPT
ncbi:hypothetical protein RSAG8_08563, partial [Rhizoctonia solani AG-8 WAC10335]